MSDLTGNEATVTPDVPASDTQPVTQVNTFHANAEDGTVALAGTVEHLRADLPAVVKESKAGYKTTEFWLAIVGLVIVNLNGLVMTLPDKYQAIATAAIAAFYAVSRGQAKSGIPDIVEAPPA